MLGQISKQSVLVRPSRGPLTAVREALAGRLALVAGFVAVYLFWGSTNLAIHFAIQTVPPFLMSGSRFLLAGAILYIYARRHGADRPKRIYLRTAVITGGLMLLGGSAIVGWAQQYLASGMASLLVATVPMWAVVVDAAARRQRPGLATMAGLALGLLGIGLLVGPESFAGGDSGAPLAMIVLLAACLSWSLGTHYSRKAAQPPSLFMSTGLNLIAGGILLMLFSAANGEFKGFSPAQVSAGSVLAMIYLVIFGSIVGFTAYMWLVKNTTPARASSNFYVNPVVAVFLGWLVLGERIGGMAVVAAAVIIAAVVLIVSQKKPAPAKVEAAAVQAVAVQAVAVQAAAVQAAAMVVEPDPLAEAEIPAEPAEEEKCWHPMC